ncbi:MAG: MAC/perforin domain-containing protein [archaeon]|nr:MAC/perforin domain-containing protein [archaeon]
MPGLDQIGLGFDIVTGKDTGLPVVLQAFSDGPTPSEAWTNPFTGAEYSFPAAIQVQGSQGTGVESYLFHSAFEYAQWQGWQFGLTMPPVGVFSMSTSTQSSKSVFATSESLLVIARQRSTLYRMTLVPASNLQLASVFLSDLQSLPATYDASSYATFISFYGTHFVTGANVGGEALAAYSVSASYADQNSDVVISASARVAFNNMKLGLGGLFSRNATASFYEASQIVDSYLLGGDPIYHSNISEWSHWVQSVPLDPAPVQRSLLPIATLISDATKRASFETAVDAYIQANNNSASSPVVQSTQLPVAGCDCFNSYSSGCPNGYLIQGYPVTGNDHDPKLPHLCCRPCFSFASAFTNMPNADSNGVHPRTDANLAQLIQNSIRASPNKSASTHKPTSTSSASSSSTQVLPIGVLGAAYDVVRGSLIGSQVIEFSYAQNKTWTYPFNQSLVYQVPDQVNVVDDSASPYTSQIFMSANNFSQAKANGFGIDFAYGMFSFSFDIAESFSSYQNNQAISGVVTQSEIFFEASVFPSASPTSFFTSFVEQTLPAEYNADLYADFLSQYGTHFVKNVAIGGQAILDAAISNQYYSSSSSTEIQTNLKALFYDLVGFGNDQGTNYTAFQQETFAQFSVLGGNQAIVAQANPNWFQDWLQSIPLAPTAVSYTLEPITTLVANPQIQQNIQLAINTYLLTASEQTQAILDSYVFPLSSSFTAPAQPGPDAPSAGGRAPRRDTSNCDTSGMWATSWNQHDGSYIAYPVSCNNLFLIEQPSNTLFQQLSWCNCVSYDSNMCPPGNFVRGFGNHYGGIEGDYPQRMFFKKNGNPLVCLFFLTFSPSFFFVI